MNAKIVTFIDGFISYDYILFGAIFVLFLLLISLSILLRKKIVLSIILILFAFMLLTFGSIFGYVEMHKYLFKNKIELISQKKLNFTKAVVVKGTILNESKFDFKSCKITAKAYKISKNSIKNFFFSFNSFQKMSILEHDIFIGEARGFKIIVEPFTYLKDYNILIKAKCK